MSANCPCRPGEWCHACWPAPTPAPPPAPTAKQIRAAIEAQARSADDIMYEWYAARIAEKRVLMLRELLDRVELRLDREYPKLSDRAIKELKADGFKVAQSFLTITLTVPSTFDDDQNAAD